MFAVSAMMAFASFNTVLANSILGEWNIVFYVAQYKTANEGEEIGIETEMTMIFEKNSLSTIQGKNKTHMAYNLVEKNGIDLLADGKIAMRGIYKIEKNVLCISISNHTLDSRPMKYALKPTEQGILIRAERKTPAPK